MGKVNLFEVVDSTHKLTLLNSCDMFSRRRDFVVKALVKCNLFFITIVIISLLW